MYEDKLTIARQKLESVVERGKVVAGPTIERILTEVPNDAIVRASTLQPQLIGRTLTVQGKTLHKHATAQLFQRLDVPTSYASSLLEGATEEAWRGELLNEIMAKHAQNSKERYLVRSIGSEVRGILSDRFRRLDSRPLLEAFIDGVKSIGGVPYEGLANDVRVSVRAIVPHIVEPIPGEAMVFGLHWHNSDYGAGTYTVNAFALRLVCLNGMMGETSIKQVHLGRRLDENLEYSARTYRLDTEATASATRDTVRALLSDAAIEKKAEQIRRAHESELSFEQGFKRVATILGKGEKESLRTHFEGPETVMLPPGRTAWRFSNALSWMANSVTDTDKKLALQEAADGVIAA